MPYPLICIECGYRSDNKTDFYKPGWICFRCDEDIRFELYGLAQQAAEQDQPRKKQKRIPVRGPGIGIEGIRQYLKEKNHGKN